MGGVGGMGEPIAEACGETGVQTMLEQFEQADVPHAVR